MDQRTSDVEEDLKDILRTRLALADKLQLLEQRVEETVQGTKNAALDVINHARNTAVDFVESATESLDPTIQASRRPWVLVGTAIAIGFAAGLIEQRRRRSGVYAYYPPEAEGADVMPSEGRARHRRGVYPYYSAHSEVEPVEAQGDGHAEGSRPAPAIPALRQVTSLWQDFTAQFAQERQRLQEAALRTGRSFLQDLAHIVVQSLIDQLERRPPSRSPR
jgi:ElaB/YqjD/DUF883 family membrane-anchored ribosome-binding protein